MRLADCRIDATSPQIDHVIPGSPGGNATGEFDEGLSSKDQAGASIMRWAEQLVAQARDRGPSGPLPWDCDE